MCMECPTPSEPACSLRQPEQFLLCSQPTSDMWLLAGAYEQAVSRKRRSLVKRAIKERPPFVIHRRACRHVDISCPWHVLFFSSCGVYCSLLKGLLRDSHVLAVSKVARPAASHSLRSECQIQKPRGNPLQCHGGRACWDPMRG